MKTIKHLIPVLITASLIACKTDEPEPENTEETITDVILSFESGGSKLEFKAKDPDSEGPKDLEIVDDIELKANTDYTLTISLYNSGLTGEDISEEVEEESDEHMFFFKWTTGLFSSPDGDGNIDNRDGKVSYNDKDDNGLPLGLKTSWKTSASAATGTMRIVLKHQPGVKSATSTSTTGESDIDISWPISVK